MSARPGGRCSRASHPAAQPVKKGFDKLADGNASSLTAATSASFSEIFQISGHENCNETIFALENEIFRRFQSSRTRRIRHRVRLEARKGFAPLALPEGFRQSESRERAALSLSKRSQQAGRWECKLSAVCVLSPVLLWK